MLHIPGVTELLTEPLSGARSHTVTEGVRHAPNLC